jgi:thiamine-monophosphate kinase
MAMGVCSKRHLIRRSGAKHGDIVAVTGVFGKTASGFKILLDGLSAPHSLGRVLVDSVLMPYTKLKEGLALAESQAVTSSIDSSDGLAWCLHELSRASNVGFRVDVLPVAAEAEQFAKLHGLDPVELALYGGEEYELVVTIKPELWHAAKKAVENVGGELVKIGLVTKEPHVLLLHDRKSVVVEARGWEHFKRAK